MIGTSARLGARMAHAHTNALIMHTTARIHIPMLGAVGRVLARFFLAGGGTPVFAPQCVRAPLAQDFFADLGAFSRRENFDQAIAGLGAGVSA